MNETKRAPLQKNTSTTAELSQVMNSLARLPFLLGVAPMVADILYYGESFNCLPVSLKGERRLQLALSWLPTAGGYFVGASIATTFVPGNVAFSVFAVAYTPIVCSIRACIQSLNMCKVARFRQQAMG